MILFKILKDCTLVYMIIYVPLVTAVLQALLLQRRAN